MHKHLVFAMSLFPACLAMSVSFAQPVITSSSSMLAVGTTDSIYVASGTVPPGPFGAGVTWNLGALSLTPSGTIAVVSTSTSPYSATFPTANYCLLLTAGSSTYNYMKISSSGQETIATSYAGSGTGQDYSPNNRLEIPYPFHYLDTVIDTYQLTTSGPQTEKLTYDGYGTLITPFHTYSNVIRVKEDYGGTDYHYAWYTVNPLELILNYSNSANNYVYISLNPAAAHTANVNADEPEVQVFPNPFSGSATLLVDAPGTDVSGTLVVTDLLGRQVTQLRVLSSRTVLPAAGLDPGMYLYTLFLQDKAIKGKFQIR